MKKDSKSPFLLSFLTQDMTRTKLFLNYFFGFIPLLFGGLIYISFRDERILFFYWLRRFNINYSLLRQIDIGTGIIQSYFVYSLPHGLWILSGVLILGVICRNRRNNFYVYASILTTMAIFHEIGQKFGIIRGTFDIADLVTIVVFSATGFLVYAFRRKNEKI